MYVDDLVTYANLGPMCHMVADSNSELVAFARKLGIPHAWYQRPTPPKRLYGHYDLGERYRTQAIRNGALAVPRVALARFMHTRRWEAPTASNRRKWERIERLTARDGADCCLCGLPLNPLMPTNHDLEITFEHVIPASEGGLATDENLMLSHRICNRKRGTHSIEAYKEFLYLKAHQMPNTARKAQG